MIVVGTIRTEVVARGVVDTGIIEACRSSPLWSLLPMAPIRGLAHCFTTGNFLYVTLILIDRYTALSDVIICSVVSFNRVLNAGVIRVKI